MASAPWALGMAAAATTSFVRTGVLAHIMHERLCNGTGEKERSTKKQQTTKKKKERKIQLSVIIGKERRSISLITHI